jgi:hypothetical protein
VQNRHYISRWLRKRPNVVIDICQSGAAGHSRAGRLVLCWSEQEENISVRKRSESECEGNRDGDQDNRTTI